MASLARRSEEARLITRWTESLERIRRDQLSGLIEHRFLFRQFATAYDGRGVPRTGAEFAAWLLRGHSAYMIMACRRCCDRNGSQSVSLRILLNELLENRRLLTRDRFRELYEGSVAAHFASRDWIRLTGGEDCALFPPARIEADILSLDQSTDTIKTVADKFIAHTDRKQPQLRLTIREIDSAVDLILKVFLRYQHLLTGSTCRPTHELETDDDFDIKELLERIWPPRIEE